jgi:hypothetical protein
MLLSYSASMPLIVIFDFYVVYSVFFLIVDSKVSLSSACRDKRLYENVMLVLLICLCRPLLVILIAVFSNLMSTNSNVPTLLLVTDKRVSRSAK